MALTHHRTAAPPEGCPLDECLALLGAPWTPRLLWYLRQEPRRFSDLQRDLGRISAKVLTARLRELEERGLIERRSIEPGARVYALSATGSEVQPVLDAMAEVGRHLRR